MAVYKVVEYGDSVLKDKAKEVVKINQSILKLLDNMKDTMYAYKGVGLAAPQVGVSKRVIVLDVGEGLVELINPVVTNTFGEETETEGCLSLPGIIGDVIRAANVTVRGLNRNGEEITLSGSGYFARAIQHEVDHLDGVLFIDKARNVHREKV